MHITLIEYRVIEKYINIDQAQLDGLSEIMAQNPPQDSKPKTDEKETSQTFIKPFSKKNWDAIVDEFEKEEEKDPNMTDLFKKIYESGNEEVRRAMNKSFQESAGTVLSTNWDNVANKKIEPKPPGPTDQPDD